MRNFFAMLWVQDLLIMGEVLKAAANGPFLSASGAPQDAPDAGLAYTLLGAKRIGPRQLAERWPEVGGAAKCEIRFSGCSEQDHQSPPRMHEAVAHLDHLHTSTGGSNRCAALCPFPLSLYPEEMSDLYRHQQGFPERWQHVSGPGGVQRIWLPVSVTGGQRPDLGLLHEGDRAAPAGDRVIPVWLRPFLGMPFLRHGRDSIEKQLAARLLEQGLATSPRLEHLMDLILRADLSSGSACWQARASKA